MNILSRFKSVFIILAVASLLVVLAYATNFWLSYGPVGPQDYYGQQHRQEKMYELVGSADSKNLVVVFPANGVDPSQYRKFASWISDQTKVGVLILKPNARVESFQPSISGILADYTKAKQFTFIGHSAGASSACKQSVLQDAKVNLVLVAGYCKDEAFKDTKTYVGIDDGLVPCSEAEMYHTVKCLDNAGHFMITDRNFEEAEKSGILELIKNDILRNLLI